MSRSFILLAAAVLLIPAAHAQDVSADQIRAIEAKGPTYGLTPAEHLLLGRAFELGIGKRKDEGTALYRYEEAAKTLPAGRVAFARLMAALQARAAQNDPTAIYLVTARSKAPIAARLAQFEKAARLGSDAAVSQLWYFYSTGQEGAVKDDAKATAFTRLAADRGSAWGQHMYGHMLYQGRGVPADTAGAMRWFRLAADQDPDGAGYEQRSTVLNARVSIASCYRDGRCGVRKDPAQALVWYRRNPNAKFEIERLLFENPQLAEVEMEPTHVAAASAPAAALAAVAATPAVLGPRVALVIGNGAYTGELGRLANPVADAQLIAASLRQAGFQVELVTDADQRAMKAAIRRLGERAGALGANSTALFYYAGHGVQSRGINYLAPVGAPLKSEADLELDAVPANAIVTQLKAAGVKTSIMILDACRNMPLARDSRDGSRGLARMDSGRGSYIAYSTAPGETAADGAGRNSLFSAALATEIAAKGVPIETVFRRVRTLVATATGGKQTPWGDSSLTEDFVFTP